MNQRTMVQGAIVGAVGGMAMAMWSMIALAASGDGFFAPTNLIAHVLWRGAPLDGGFDAGALALGLGVHMMMSMALGVTIAAALTFRPSSTAFATVVAMLVPIAAWGAQLVAWEAVDPAGHAQFTPWVLFVGHLMFAMVTTIWAVTPRPDAATAVAGSTPSISATGHLTAAHR